MHGTAREISLLIKLSSSDINVSHWSVTRLYNHASYPTCAVCSHARHAVINRAYTTYSIQCSNNYCRIFRRTWQHREHENVVKRPRKQRSLNSWRVLGQNAASQMPASCACARPVDRQRTRCDATSLRASCISVCTCHDV